MLGFRKNDPFLSVSRPGSTATQDPSFQTGFLVGCSYKSVLETPSSSGSETTRKGRGQRGAPRCPGAELPAGLVHEVQSQNDWLSKVLTLLKYRPAAKSGF